MELKGQLRQHILDSQVLKGNPLGDPTRRELWVYVPPGYEGEKGRDLPVIFVISGFTGNCLNAVARGTWKESDPERIERLLEEGKLGPCIFVWPDCFTAFGGSQYLNSSAVGNYEDYLVKELVGFVRENYSAGPLALAGKSSGGYGAIIQGMQHPEVFEAIACHSGDSMFELCYLDHMAKGADGLRKHGGVKGFMEWFKKQKKKLTTANLEILDAIAMSACYCPNPEAPEGFDFPVDTETGLWREDVWQRFIQWDPVRRMDHYQDNLKKLKGIFIDCGSKDEFGLHWGARAMHHKLEQAGIDHTYEEFDDGHMGISYRYDVSFPFLYEALKG